MLAAATATLPFAGAQADDQKPVQYAAVDSPDVVRVSSTPESPTQASFSEVNGHPVELIFGSAVTETDISVLESVIEDSGCNVSLRELGASNKIFIKTNGQAWSTRDPISAGGWAVDHCTNG